MPFRKRNSNAIRGQQAPKRTGFRTSHAIGLTLGTGVVTYLGSDITRLSFLSREEQRVTKSMEFNQAKNLAEIESAKGAFMKVFSEKFDKFNSAVRKVYSDFGYVPQDILVLEGEYGPTKPMHIKFQFLPPVELKDYPENNKQVQEFMKRLGEVNELHHDETISLYESTRASIMNFIKLKTSELAEFTSGNAALRTSIQQSRHDVPVKAVHDAGLAGAIIGFFAGFAVLRKGAQRRQARRIEEKRRLETDARLRESAMRGASALEQSRPIVSRPLPIVAAKKGLAFTPPKPRHKTRGNPDPDKRNQ